MKIYSKLGEVTDTGKKPMQVAREKLYRKPLLAYFSIAQKPKHDFKK